ncbi:MAG: hypothetical protein HYX49_07100 [Chloroflexi bacterium]|nr:hypothetical protein [Chloroflexota bacterium]
MKNISASFFVFAALQVLLLCVGLSISGTGLGGLFGAMTAQEENIGTFLVLYGGVLSILSPILFILALVTGFALRAEKGWGRVVGIITAILSILDAPLGTLFGIYWLTRFFRK